MSSALCRRLSFAVGATLWFWPSASAALEIVLRNVDPPGVGLNDSTPVDPVGTNEAVTLGEQRWAAVQLAADAWGEALSGSIPLVVHVSMADLPCGSLGASRSGSYVTNVAGANDDRVYSLALAEKLAGKRFNTDDEPDVFLELNGAECPEQGPTWYLGFDGDAPAGAHALVNVAAHEFAHGLGFESLVNPADGRALMDAAGLDPFSRMLFDTRNERYWYELSAAQRRSSAETPRSLVWGGPLGQRAALARLSVGSPVLDAIPPIPGFSGMVTLPALFRPFERIEARVRSVLPADGCTESTPTTVEHVLLVAEGSCSPSRVAQLAAEAGALAVLEVTTGDRLPPPGFGRREVHADAELSIPVARIGAADGALLDADSGVSVALFMDPERLAGADEAGRPFMYTPTQSALGISLSHWDPSLGPSCLLEPVPAADLRKLDIELERAALFDIGWGDPERSDETSARGPVLGGGCSTVPARTLSTVWFPYACFVALLLCGRRDARSATRVSRSNLT